VLNIFDSARSFVFTIFAFVATWGSFVGAAGFSFFPASAQAQATISDSSVAVFNAQMRLMTAKSMSRGLSEGRSYGKTFFKLAFIGSCAFLTAAGDDVAAFTTSANDALKVKDEPYETGFQSGWIIGYTLAFKSVWAPCEAQLEENVRSAMRARVEECRTRAEELLASASIQDALHGLPRDALTPELKKHMLSLIVFKDEAAAWSALLKEEHVWASKLPCQIAATEAVIAYLSRNAP